MKDNWTDEPTRIHQYVPPAKGIRGEDAEAHESSTVIENRESLLARVSASMAVPEGTSPTGSAAGAFALPGMIRKPVAQPPISDLPVSRGARRSKAAAAAVTFPFGHDDENTAADLTPPPIQTRRHTGRPITGDALRTVPSRSASARLGPHLPITVGIVASFVLGLALRNEPPRHEAPSRGLVQAAAAGPTIQRRLAPPPGLARPDMIPAGAVLKITTSPPGAYVAVDHEVGPGPTPRTVAVPFGRWVTVKALRPGFRPASRTVYVQQASTEIEIPLEAYQPSRPARRR